MEECINRIRKNDLQQPKAKLQWDLFITTSHSTSNRSQRQKSGKPARNVPPLRKKPQVHQLAPLNATIGGRRDKVLSLMPDVSSKAISKRAGGRGSDTEDADKRTSSGRRSSTDENGSHGAGTLHLNVTASTQDLMKAGGDVEADEERSRTTEGLSGVKPLPPIRHLLPEGDQKLSEQLEEAPEHDIETDGVIEESKTSEPVAENQAKEERLIELQDTNGALEGDQEIVFKGPAWDNIVFVLGKNDVRHLICLHSDSVSF